MVPGNDIETIAAGCVWAHKELCLEFNRSWDGLGALADALIACKTNKDSFPATFDDDQLFAFYRVAVRLLANDVGSMSKISAAISALDLEQTGRLRACSIGWIGSVACLAILCFYRDTHTKPTVVTQVVSVKATMMPNLTTQPWDMATVDNFQLAATMNTFGRFKDEPGAKRALRSTLCWLRDYIDGHAVLGKDICWSEEDPGNEFYQQLYKINYLGNPFMAFWDEALEAITTDNLVGIMCIVPEEFRGVATIGSGFVNFGVSSVDPHQTLSTAELLGSTLGCMLTGWSCDYDMEHGISGGNGLALWCPTTRDRISIVAMDRHRSWCDKEVYWRAHMAANAYFLASVRHFAAIRRTIACSMAVRQTASPYGSTKINIARFSDMLCTIGLSEDDVVDAGPVTILRPCENCYSLDLFTDLFAASTGIPTVCSRLGERGLQAAACMDLMGLRLFPAMREYIGAGCECSARVIGSCFIDGHVHCGMGTPSSLLKLNAEMQKRWTSSLEQHIKDKAVELGYSVDEHSGRMYSVPLTEIDAHCCT